MLRPDTEALWRRLRDERLLEGFVLVGGTALSLHLDHRVSEDLDFMFLDRKLPVERLKLLRRKLELEGISLVPNDSPAGVEEFAEAGLEFNDFQQDFIANGTVKLTFVAPEPENRKQLEPVPELGPRVASLPEIFRLKCIVAADRSKTRDWFDLYTMLKIGRFQPLDIYRAFERAGAVSKYDIAMMRLCSGKPSVNDEGFEALLENPPTLEEMRDYFVVVRDKVEQAAAALVAPATKPGEATDAKSPVTRRPGR